MVCLPSMHRLLQRLIAGLLAALSFAALAQAPEATALRATHQRLQGALAASPFRRPLLLESIEGPSELRGEVYGVVDASYEAALGALRDKRRWCELLMLHLNVNHCATRGQPPSENLRMRVGRKTGDGPEDGYPMEFGFELRSAGPDYLRVQMSADDGPLSTRDYRLVLELTPLDAGRSFVHLSYAYGYGTLAKLATSTYLSTLGRNKVGFTVTGRNADGTPVYIGGVRGMLERNVMRYYLAIETYLGALSAPPAEQAEKRLRDWFAATERTPRQLRELALDEYLANKRRQLQRMAPATAPG